MDNHVSGILSLDPDKYRELDGVVFDLDSYARHCGAPEPVQQAAAPEQPCAPAPVFPISPVHLGWYEAATADAPVPCMGGCLAPTPEDGTVQEDGTVTHTRFVCGSGSGSYATSYRTSWRSSGSGSYRFGSGTFLVGGYGLELI